MKKCFSKWNQYDEILKQLLLDNPEKNLVWYAQQTLKTKDSSHANNDVNELARYIGRHKGRILDTHEGTFEATNGLDVDNTTVKHMWLKDKGASVFIKNPNYVDLENEPEKEIDFLSIFKDKIDPISVNKELVKPTALFDRLVLTDIHVGMDVNKDGFALYDGEWNEEVLFKRLDLVVKHTLANQKSNKLLIHELGDYMDGWDGFTTRGGHKLPQNMDNQKMFDVGLKFKIALIDSLMPFFEEIKIVNICNDNHAGSFGYIVNSAFKTYMDLKYPIGLEVFNQRRFIDHHTFQNRCFILTHGKDDKSLKFGFKPTLDAPQIEKIKNYIDEHRLYQHKIEFSKGDSHQLILDFTSSTSFEYQNFGAFSPPSDWVKTNFKNTISCFTHFNYFEDQKSINNYIF